MIIQHPDGSYEFRCIPSATSLWLRTLSKRVRSLAASAQRRLLARGGVVCAQQCACSAGSRSGR